LHGSVFPYFSSNRILNGNRRHACPLAALRFHFSTKQIGPPACLFCSTIFLIGRDLRMNRETHTVYRSINTCGTIRIHQPILICFSSNRLNYGSWNVFLDIEFWKDYVVPTGPSSAFHLTLPNVKERDRVRKSGFPFWNPLQSHLLPDRCDSLVLSEV
jgi:hypothetical protein